MRMTILAALSISLAACAVPDATAECRDFSRALCERTVACDPTDSQAACLQRVDSALRCADVIDLKGEPGQCTLDVADLTCADVDAKRLPPSCDDVKFVGP